MYSVDGKKLPPLGIRRMKSDAASDLPLKKYEKYPVDMVDIQAEAYDQMLHKLRTLQLDGGGSAFSTVNSLRSLSLHPEKLELASQEDDGIFAFLQKSARILSRQSLMSAVDARHFSPVCTSEKMFPD